MSKDKTAVAIAGMRSKQTGEAGKKSLLECVVQGNIEGVKKLLDAGVSPNTYNHDGIFQRPAIYYAIKNNSMEIVLLFIQNSRFDPSFKMLSFNLNVLKFCKKDVSSFEREQDVGDKYLIKSSLLDVIIESDNAELFDVFFNYLLTKAKAPDGTLKFDFTSAVFTVIEKNKPQFLERILKADKRSVDQATERFAYNINNPGLTPLGLAVIKCNMGMVRSLIDYGGAVKKCMDGISALCLAAYYSRIEIADFLLSRGADPNELQTVVSIGTKIEILKSRKETIETFQKKLEQGFDKDIVKRYQEYKLQEGQICRIETQEQFLKLLEDDLHKKTKLLKEHEKREEGDVKKNQTIFEILISQKDIESRYQMADLLINYNVEIKEDYFYLAIQFGEIYFMRILLARGEFIFDDEKISHAKDLFKSRCGECEESAAMLKLMDNEIKIFREVEKETPENKQKVFVYALKYGDSKRIAEIAEIAEIDFQADTKFKSDVFVKEGIVRKSDTKFKSDVFVKEGIVRKCNSDEFHLTEYAVEFGNVRAIKVMFDKQAYFSGQTDYLTLALNHHNLDVIKLLLDNGIKLVRDHRGQGAIHYACTRGNIEHLKILCEKFNECLSEIMYDVESEWTPIHLAIICAITKQDPRILQYLIKEKKSDNIDNIDQYTRDKLNRFDSEWKLHLFDDKKTVLQKTEDDGAAAAVVDSSSEQQKRRDQKTDPESVSQEIKSSDAKGETSKKKKKKKNGKKAVDSEGVADKKEISDISKFQLRLQTIRDEFFCLVKEIKEKCEKYSIAINSLEEDVPLAHEKKLHEEGSGSVQNPEAKPLSKKRTKQKE